MNETSDLLIGTDRFKAMPEDKRKRVLEAIEQEILEVGYRAASTNDIAREAKVSKGAMFSYFTSKDMMLAALIEYRLRPARRHFVDARAVDSFHSAVDQTFVISADAKQDARGPFVITKNEFSSVGLVQAVCACSSAMFASIEAVIAASPKFPAIAELCDQIGNDKRQSSLFSIFATNSVSVIHGLCVEAGDFITHPVERAVKYVMAPKLAAIRDEPERSNLAMQRIPTATRAISRIFLDYALIEFADQRASIRPVIEAAVMSALIACGE